MQKNRLAGLLFLFSLVVAHAEPGVGSGTISVGQSAALTGSLAENGIQYAKGAKLYFDHVNGKGGVHGRKIDLVTLDDAYDPKRAEKNTRKLIEEKKVFALFGYTGTGASLAALPLADKAQVPFLMPLTGAEPLRARVNPFIYHLRAGYGDEMDKIVEYQTTMGVSKIAIAYQNDSFGKAGLKSFIEAMERRNLKPAAIAAIDPATLDARPTVQELSKGNPTAIVLATAENASPAVVKEFVRIGNIPQFFGLSVVSAKQMQAGLHTVGIVVAQITPSPWNTKVGIVRQYRELLAGAGDDPHYASLEGYIAARVFVEALKRVGNDPTRTKLLTALDGMRQMDFGGYLIDFSDGRHVASSYVDLSILRPNGQFLQ